MRKKKIFLILVIITFIFCLLSEMGHSYTIEGYTDESAVWEKQTDTKGYIFNSFSQELNRGEYKLSFHYQNSTGQQIVYRLLDMEHNDGNNNSGVVVAEGVLSSGEGEETVPFKLERDSYKIQLYAEQEFMISNWRIELTKDYYTDWIFLFLFLTVIIYVYYLKTDWRKPQYILGLTSLGILITTPFAGDLLNFNGIHDIAFHLSRIRGMAEALSYGQFPARINVDINQGYGFVSEMLYPNLFVYFPALLTLLGMSVMTAYKCWILFINIGTVLIGYYSFSRLLKSEKLGAVCGVLYLINPYRLNNIFLRASIGEVLAEMFLPFLVYAFAEVLYGNYKKWPQLSVAAIGILQSHIISLEVCILFVVIFCLVSWKCFISKEGWQRIVSCVKAAGAVLILNLWFLIPFLDQFRKEYNLVSDVRSLSREAVYLHQMFMSFFDVSGYNISDGISGEMPLTIGIVLLLGSACFLYYAYGVQKIEGRLRRIGSISLLFGSLSCYMATDYFPWDFLQKHCAGIYNLLAKMQFPWRMLGYASLFLCIVTSIAFLALYREQKSFLLYGALGMSAFMMLECMDGYLTDSVSTITSRNQNTCKAFYSDYYRDDLTGNNLWILQEYGEKIITEDGVAITDFEKEGTDLKFHFEKTQEMDKITLQMPLYNYGLHRAYLGEEELIIQNGAYGMISVEVPTKVTEGDINVVYVGRKIYKAADLCSVIAVIGTMSYVIVKKRKKYKVSIEK